MAAKSRLQFTLTDQAEVEVVADFVRRDLPIRRAGRWWLVSSVRLTKGGVTFRAVSSVRPLCGKANKLCGQPATHLMVVSDGERFQTYYRCEPCSQRDRRMFHRHLPECTVTTTLIEGLT